MLAPRTYLSSLELIGIKLGLDQIHALLAALDHPDRAYRAIVIAGTNGKGSVSAMLERGLRSAGYRTGRYTSPHLVRLEERFAVNGVDIDAEALEAAIARTARAAASLPAPPTFFEATTAVGLDLFRDAGIDVALLEVGLGGRLDATNAVAAEASVITAIDFDHQQYLGHTIEAIAGEKAGVIKPATFCVLARNPPAVVGVVEAQCRAVNADLVLAANDIDVRTTFADGRARISMRTPCRQHDDLTLGLRGRHQIDNAITAVRALDELDARGRFTVGAADVRAAVEDVTWPTRLETARVHGHDVLIDGAHNAAGAAALAAYLREVYGRPVPVVLGVLGDKDLEAVVSRIATAASHVVCTTPASPRAAAPADLAAIVRRVAPGVGVETVDPPVAAIEAAARHGSPVVVAGSLYLAGEVRAHVS